MALHNREKMINNREKEDSASPTTPPAPQNHPLYTPQQRPSLKSKALDLIPWILLFAASYIFFRYTMNSHTSGCKCFALHESESMCWLIPCLSFTYWGCSASC